MQDCNGMTRNEGKTDLAKDYFFRLELMMCIQVPATGGLSRALFNRDNQVRVLCPG
jgi:hypothetical protein